MEIVVQVPQCLPDAMHRYGVAVIDLSAGEIESDAANA